MGNSELSFTHQIGCACAECKVADVLLVCRMILAPDNQNLRNQDVVGCVRDVAQVAMIGRELLA